jgi:hypothetical protein
MGRSGTSREWVNFHYHPRPVQRPQSTALRWARDARWQLFDDGRLFDVAADPSLEHPIDPAAASPAAAAARARLEPGLAALPRRASQPRR